MFANGRFLIIDDGKVFVNIATINNERVFDTSSWREISDAATRIVRTCFRLAIPGGGGMVTEIGAYYSDHSGVEALACLLPIKNRTTWL